MPPHIERELAKYNLCLFCWISAIKCGWSIHEADITVTISWPQIYGQQMANLYPASQYLLKIRDFVSYALDLKHAVKLTP